MQLSNADFQYIVHRTPLVAIDLIVHDGAGRMLLGHRRNPPAQGHWFVPGGRIRKGETLDAAFTRLTADELGIALDRGEARFAGVYDHFYEDDFTGATEAGTHYIVLAYLLQLEPDQLSLPPDQHDGYRWADAASARTNASIHENSRVYFDALDQVRRARDMCD